MSSAPIHAINGKLPLPLEPAAKLPVQIPETILAWAAGLFDGEGCVFIHKSSSAPKSRPQQRSPVYALTIRVKMIHRPTIEFLASTFGVGTIRRHAPGRLNKRVTWSWDVASREAEAVLRALLPYMRVKKEEAELAIKFSEANYRTVGGNKRVPKQITEMRETMYAQLKALKQREWAA